MKRIMGLILALGLMVCGAPGLSRAGEDMQMPPVYKGSAEFEKLKELAGAWEGKEMMGGQEMPIRVEYEVTSNGSVVVEHLFPGTPHAMISTYYDKNGKLAMTHYCAIGNQPHMSLISADNNQFKFDLSPDSGIDPTKEDHMHSLLITVIDKDHISHDWGCYKGGKPGEPTKFNLTRVK